MADLEVDVDGLKILNTAIETFITPWSVDDVRSGH